jgi:RsiW-degrading membrane proteinase PrsW (M82 family)
MNFYGLIAALLIAFVYLNFLRQMDVFEKEKKRYTLLAFSIGVFSTFLLIPFQLCIPIARILPSDGVFLVRLKYHFFAVAIIEEFIKIIPFLVFLRMPRVMDESFDYIKYASAGALGFATLENILYFNSSLYIIEGRAFYTAILHMFTSSLIAYYIIKFKSKGERLSFVLFISLFSIASFIHALYNALVSRIDTHCLGILLIAILLVIWGRMMNNLLNNSQFFNLDSVQNKVVMSGVKLLVGWALVFFYAASAIAITDGNSFGLNFLREGASFGAVTGVGLYFTLARPRLIQGKWFPLFSSNRFRGN